MTMAVGLYALTTLAGVKVYVPGLGTATTYDTLLESLIDAISARAETYCNRKFITRTYTAEVYDGNNEEYLILKQWPIVSVTSITEDDNSLTLTTDYQIINDNGQLYRVDNYWSDAEPRNILITYDAGYLFPSVGAVNFSGSGLNDCTSGGNYSDVNSSTFTIVIDGVSTVNTFKWKKGSGSYTNGVSITGTAQTLSDGVTITFGATGGHTLADQWTIAAQTRTLPYDLEDAIRRQVVKSYNDINNKTLGKTSISTKDGSANPIPDSEWMTEVKTVLDHYRNILCG